MREDVNGVTSSRIFRATDVLEELREKGRPPTASGVAVTRILRQSYGATMAGRPMGGVSIPLLPTLNGANPGR
jgi:hypothetical protein